MKTCKLGTLIVLASLLVTSCVLKPDLVVTAFQTEGPPTVNAQNSVEVPVRVIVKNQGNADAGIFKVSMEYSESGFTFSVAFTVPGQGGQVHEFGQDGWYPYTSASLAAGRDIAFAGRVIFHPSVHGETVSLKAIADSCDGDEFTPRDCRVEESDETNNESATISLSLP